MKLQGVLPLVFLLGITPALMAQRGDFLTDDEAETIRSTAQEPAKRIATYLDFAAHRLKTLRTNLASGKPGVGRATQKNLSDYNRILQAINDTIDDARSQRVPISKALKKTAERDEEFLKYLQSINSESSPDWKDYQFTLDEAVSSTKDQMDSANQGEFPEVRQRTPPTDLPAKPPRQ